MIEKYRLNISFYGTKNPIQKVQVERESENSVWINGSRSNKVTDYYCYFDSFDHAKGHAVLNYERRVKSAQSIVANLTGKLEFLEALKENK